MPNVAIAEQRAVQRRAVGRVTCGGVLNRDGLPVPLANARFPRSRKG
ncbi:hypothetical protein ACIRYZ_32355 [Kitasatospora sp. NPDC101155]